MDEEENQQENTPSVFESPREAPPAKPAGQEPIPFLPKPSSGKRRKIILIIIVILAVVGLAFVGWKIFFKPNKSETPTQATHTQPPQQASTSDIPESTATESYKSDVLGVTLKKPANWTATEANGGVRLESPEFSYQTTQGNNVTGNFRIYIRKGAREVDGKYIGRGVAIAPSEKITYSDPLPNQRKETLLSSFGYDDTTHFAFFMIAGNFNLKKGDTLGPNYGKEPDAFIVAGGYSAQNLADDLAMNPVPTETYSQSNAYKQAIEIIKSLQLR